MNKEDMVKIGNRGAGTVCYKIPELNIRRVFQAGEVKEISFNELQQLSWIPGGEVLLREFLVIFDDKPREEVLTGKPEPEYFYKDSDIRNIMENGTLNQFLDMLDFAPEGVLDVIK